MLPVTCAVKMPRLRNPIKSTMPAITLSNVGSHGSDREGITPIGDAPASACTAVGSVVDMVESLYYSRLRLFQLRLSMINFGTISPKVIARITSRAIEPSASVASMSSHVLCELLVSCKRPLAILNIRTPGIIETTEAKPMAAKGMCQRRETGAMITPTMRHAANAPVAALAPSELSATHLSAWAAAPTAIGQGSIFRGEEKKTL